MPVFFLFGRHLFRARKKVEIVDSSLKVARVFLVVLLLDSCLLKGDEVHQMVTDKESAKRVDNFLVGCYPGSLCY